MTADSHQVRARAYVRIRSLVAYLERAREGLAASIPEPAKVSWIILGPLLGVASVIQLAMLRPPFPSDSLVYFNWAADLGRNDISHGTTRLGVLIPVRWAIEAFGTSEIAYYIVPFALSLLLIGATYVVGVKLSGSQVIGAGAAMTIVLSTLVLELNSQILPDTFAAAWFVLALALFLSAPPGSHRAWWILAGSVACGIAYMSREYVVFMAPLLVLVAWTRRWTRRDWGLAVGVFALILLAEMTALTILFGDPFARFNALAGFAERGATGQSALLTAYGADATHWTVLSRAPGAFAEYAVGKLLMISIPFGIAFAIFDRSRHALWLTILTWIAALWIPMMLLAGILDPLTPRIRDNHIRYWFLAVPALYLLLWSIVCVSLGRLRRRGAATVASLVAVAIVGGALIADIRSVPPDSMFRAFGATQWGEVRDWLRTDHAQDLDRIYIDRRLAMVLPIYTKEVLGATIWTGEIAYYEKAGEFLSTYEMDGAVIVHELGVRYLRNRGLTVPNDYLDPAPGWETRVRRGDGTLTIIAPARYGNELGSYLDLRDRLIEHEIPLGSVLLRGDVQMGESSTFITTGSDPQLHLPEDLRSSSSAFLVAAVEGVAESTRAALFWRSSGETFDDGRTESISLEPDSHYIIFDLSDVPVDSALRLDPGEVAGITVTKLSLIEIVSD